MALSLYDRALKNVSEMFGISELKHHQKLLLASILDNKDCIAVLPTGYGKSLPFQMYLPMRRKLSEETTVTVTDKVLVCSPLVSLMSDQVQKLTGITSITAGYTGFSPEMDKNIKEGLVDLIYASPETLVGDPEWRSHLGKLNVTLIVVDEFHTISTWGEDTDGQKKQAFRKWFASVGELRSLFPNAPLLALSATCTTKIRNRVGKILNLKEKAVEIMISPNKSNIKLSVSKINNSIEMSMSWLVDGLEQLQEKFPRTLIYCTTINDTSKIYTYLLNELPHLMKYVEMYHSETPKMNKEKIMANLKTADSSLRIVVSTSALGMGIDVKDCHSVILFGAPSNPVEFVQEIGRAGRDQMPSIAMLLCNSYHQSHMDPDLKELMKTSDCRRIILMKCFLKETEMEQIVKETGLHSCCDNCAEKCECNACSLLTLEKLYHTAVPSFDNSDDSFQSDSEATEQYDLSDYTDESEDIPDI